MNAIMFDKEKVKKCIDAYHDEKGAYPYLIMSEKTKTDLLDKSPSDISAMEITSITSISFCVNNTTHTTEESKKLPVWKNAKILFDNDLEFGEIYVR